jgi:glycosyltransferase involved in cell wall biosynthesis
VKQIKSLPAFDVINLHWIAGFLDYEVFFEHLPRGVPLVWRMADMNAFTGGCHYDRGCGKFAARCGACPVLGSSTDNDLSRQAWTRKHRALAGVASERMHVVGTSRWIAEQARKSSLLGRFPSSVIPNGLDTEVFAPRDKPAARAALGVPAGAKAVLFVADSAAATRKGFAYLAAALAQLAGEPELFLMSVGGNKPDVPGIPQVDLGRIYDDQKLSQVYSAADVFVIPSLQESFGQTVTESMACGTPVVGFDTGGIPDMVRPGETGYLARVGDAADLADKIRRLLREPERWPEFGRNCRAAVLRDFSIEALAGRYAALYQTLAASNANPVASRSGRAIR